MREGEREGEGERKSARGVFILYTEYCTSVILALLAITDCGHVVCVLSYPILGLYMYVARAMSAT
jgi:hypothetical protein